MTHFYLPSVYQAIEKDDVMTLSRLCTEHVDESNLWLHHLVPHAAAMGKLSCLKYFQPEFETLRGREVDFEATLVYKVIESGNFNVLIYLIELGYVGSKEDIYYCDNRGEMLIKYLNYMRIPYSVWVAEDDFDVDLGGNNFSDTDQCHVVGSDTEQCHTLQCHTYYNKSDINQTHPTPNTNRKKIIPRDFFTEEEKTLISFYSHKI